MRKKRNAEVADHEGEYTNFTGKIDWKGNRGTVENATFKLDKMGYIWWREGVWKDGVFKAVASTDGTWEND